MKREALVTYCDLVKRDVSKLEERPFSPYYKDLEGKSQKECDVVEIHLDLQNGEKMVVIVGEVYEEWCIVWNEWEYLEDNDDGSECWSIWRVSHAY